MAEDDAEIEDEDEDKVDDDVDDVDDVDDDDDDDDDDDERRTKKSRRRRHRAEKDEVTPRQPHVITVDHPFCKAIMISNKMLSYHRETSLRGAL